MAQRALGEIPRVGGGPVEALERRYVVDGVQRIRGVRNFEHDLPGRHEKVELPESWTADKKGTFCLLCRRERAAQAALDAAPENSGLEDRAKLRRAALVEFEVRRRPNHGNGEIAKACRSSVAAVVAARKRLKIPAPQ